MRLLPWLLFAALLTATPAFGADVAFGRYHALIIGIDDYRHLPRLKSAVNDARAVDEVLRREYGYSTTLLLDPTRAQMLRALERAREELSNSDNLLIFYAGHGQLDRAADNGFWLPVDAEADSQVEWVPVSTVTGMLRAATAKHVLVIADSCYSGTLTRDAPAPLASTARQVELDRIASLRARKALTSGGLEPVWDGGGDGHSVFSRALLRALRGNREVLDGYGLFRQLRRNVVVNAEQTPTYGDIRFAGDEGGDFLFVPLSRARATPPKAAAPAAPAPAPPDPETVFWQSIQNSTEAGDYRAYLQQFPTGVFAPLARTRIERLTAPKEVDVAAIDPRQEEMELLEDYFENSAAEFLNEIETYDQRENILSDGDVDSAFAAALRGYEILAYENEVFTVDVEVALGGGAERHLVLHLRRVHGAFRNQFWRKYEIVGHRR